MISLRLYGHDYCSLCGQMRQTLAQDYPQVSVQWIDIEDQLELEERFGELVPVLCDAQDREICHYHLDLPALDAYLAKFG